MRCCLLSNSEHLLIWTSTSSITVFYWLQYIDPAHRTPVFPRTRDATERARRPEGTHWLFARTEHHVGGTAWMMLGKEPSFSVTGGRMIMSRGSCQTVPAEVVHKSRLHFNPRELWHGDARSPVQSYFPFLHTDLFSSALTVTKR